MWDELAENLLCLEEQNWENLVKNGTKEQRLDFLKRKEKYSLLAILDKCEKLEKQLKIAILALEYIKKLPVRVCCDNTAEQALKEIKAVNDE